MPTPFDLMVAPNGARLMPSDHPALPVTHADTVATAVACEQAGATSIHVHVREDDGRHSLVPDRYNAVTADIAAQTNLNVQISTEAADLYDVPAQRHCLANVTAMDASIGLREIARDPAGLQATYADVAARGISIQHILYDASEVTQLLHHFDADDIPEQNRRAIFVLGRYAKDQRSTPEDLSPFLQAMGNETLAWSVCAFGPQEHACALAALNAGGSVRIGFENNRIAPDGAIFPDNATSVATFVESAGKAGFVPQRQIT